jgi:hypothetical protein
MNRKEHAARINEAWQKGVEAIIETGRRINDAREELGGTASSRRWCAMICTSPRAPRESCSP